MEARPRELYAKELINIVSYIKYINALYIQLCAIPTHRSRDLSIKKREKKSQLKKHDSNA